MPDVPDPLALFTDDELAAELCRRYTEGIIMLTRPNARNSIEANQGMSRLLMRRAGSLYAARGMVHHLDEMLASDLHHALNVGQDRDAEHRDSDSEWGP